MNIILIFTVVYAAFIAMSFWESYSEGRNAWHNGKLGWKIKLSKRYCLPAYVFFNLWVMWPLLLSLPLVIYGWDFKLFGVLLSAFLSGMVLQDFMWYVINPAVKISEFNPKFADYYPWLKIGKFQIPVYYIGGIVLSILSWYFIWR